MRSKVKFKVIDLFAGAGGFGLGFSMAEEKYQLVCSIEIDKWAVETLRANNRESQFIIHDDIKRFDTKKKIKAICKIKPDVIIGGPPCQGFSFAGPIKDPKDPRNSLFRYFVKWVDVLQPKIFVMENVPGLLSRKNESGEKVIDIIKRSFEKIGYYVNVWKLNAANYGVPQNRERVFIVGHSHPLEIPPPPITNYLPSQKQKLNGKAKGLKMAVTVRQAIGDLPSLSAGEGAEVSQFTRHPKTDYQRMVRGDSELLFNHVTMIHTKRVVERYRQIIGGIKIDQVSEELKVRKRNGKGVLSEVEYKSNYRHLKPSMVSYTIPASFYSSFIHSSQPRNITSREAARLQSFPDSYLFKGKRTQVSSKLLKQLGKDDENHLSQYNQIGNAVPPLLAKAIATWLYNFLLLE